MSLACKQNAYANKLFKTTEFIVFH